MKLYHGTCASKLGSIMEHGIQPRGEAGGNWNEFPSREDMVYLTSAYAPYFAISSCTDEGKGLVIEVESDRLDQTLLHPDEDFIAQALAHQRGCGIEDVHDEVRGTLEDYRHHWRDSLSGLGNCAYRGAVPLSAITRACVIDLRANPEVSLIACDPCISLLNFRFCGDKYRSILAWLFGDRPDFLLGVHGDNEIYIANMESVTPGYRSHVNQLFSNRSFVTITEVNP